MKIYIFSIVAILFLWSCKTSSITENEKNSENNFTIDLIDVKNDKVKVTFRPKSKENDTIIYYIPKTVPGTYSVDNYGRFISNLEVVDKLGNKLETKQLDTNRWEIYNAKQIDKISYLVDDSFDNETSLSDEDRIFSPSGTNILNNKNFVLNLHGFVGYIQETQNLPYQISIKHFKNISAATSRKFIANEEKNYLVDTYKYNRYAEVTDDPIFYGNLDNVTFKINDIEILLSVYSPNKIHTAESLLPSMKRMMTAQKNFMGDINSTKKYSILLYLSTMNNEDAQGFGALEHNNSTVVVLPEVMPLNALEESMIDVVSHEFFHIIAPLTIHSEEIHYFDYNDPKMSQHLWMYEGTIEYFAQLFQVYEGLISEKEFLKRITEKIKHSKSYDDQMSFTTMSKNILKEPYKSNYINVYEKGALISLCIDIIIRETTNGEKGILDLMKDLSNKYGAQQPFKDEELIPEVIELTNNKVGDFLNLHVIGTTPIPYEKYFEKVGLTYKMNKKETGFFINDYTPFIAPDRENNQIYFNDYENYNSFLKDLEIQPKDVLISINDKKFDLKNARSLFEISKKWEKNTKIEMIINRNGEKIKKTSIIKEKPYVIEKTLESLAQDSLSSQQIITKKAWLNL